MIPFWLKETLALFRFYQLRFSLALIGIVIGIGAVCALVAIHASVTKNTDEFMEKLGGSRFGLSILANNSLERKLVNRIFSLQNIDDFCNKLSPLFTVIPYQVLGISAFYQFHKIQSQVVVVKPSLFRLMQWPLEQGRWLMENDSQQKVVVIGCKLANSLAMMAKIDPPQLIGKLINIESMYFKIVGIIQENEFNPLLDFDPNHTIFLGMHMLNRLKGGHPFDTFLVQGTSSLINSQEQLKEQLHSKYAISRVFTRDANIFRQALIKHVQSLLQVLAIVAVITLLLGVVSILNILLILMNERKREMGVRLALGSTPKQIGCQFLRETLILCIIGGIGGIVFGQISAYYIIVKRLNLLYYGEWLSWFVGLGVSLLLGGIVGLPPVSMSRLTPSKLLKS